ncbi:MAG: O-antigen ligase family protein [Rhodospirillales bacterium]
MSVQQLLTPPATMPQPLAACYALACLLMPVVSLFNARALVPIAAVAALSALIVVWRRRELAVLVSTDRWLLALIAAYIVAQTAASLGGPAIGDSMRSVAKFTGIAVMLLTFTSLQSLLDGDDRKWIFLTLLASVAAALAMILFDVFFGGMLSELVHGYDMQSDHIRNQLGHYGYFWYKSASSFLGVAVLVLGIYAHKHAGALPALVLVALGALAAHQIDSRTAAFGVILALAAGALYHFLGRYRLRLLIAAMGFAFLLPVWISASGISPSDISDGLSKKVSAAHSIVYRLHIWDFTTDKIMEKPVLGWGAGASKRVGTDAKGAVTDPKFGNLGEPIPVHPHNAVLQIWLEFGLVGAVTVFLLIARALTLADRLAAAPGTRIWTFSVVALLVCFFGFNFSISSSWWLASVAVFIALASIFARNSGTPASP